MDNWNGWQPPQPKLTGDELEKIKKRMLANLSPEERAAIVEEAEAIAAAKGREQNGTGHKTGRGYGRGSKVEKRRRFQAHLEKARKLGLALGEEYACDVQALVGILERLARRDKK
jgi:hypothetical protein